MTRWFLFAVTVLTALLFGAPSVYAHPMPHSVIVLDVRGSSVTATISIPADQDFVLASGVRPESVSAVRDYLVAHLHPTSVLGRPWSVRVGNVSLNRTELIASAVLTPPAGGNVRHFRLGYDAVVHQVVTHQVFVSVREDWAAGRVAPAPIPAGVIELDPRTMTVPDLTVDLGRGSAWSGFLAMFRLGGEHIVSGTDHLLFLLVLLLPATLQARGGRWRTPAGVSQATGGGRGHAGRGAPQSSGGRRRGACGALPPAGGVLPADGGGDGGVLPPDGGRWRGYGGARRAVSRIAAVTLAFTVGHSVALAASALGRLAIPVWPVEAFIAASILVGAAHAIRPIFPAREAVVASLFGLGHGMAFSFTLAEMGLSGGQLAVSLLGFNLGIEAVQLMLVALALPALIMAARLPIQPLLRVGGALLAAIASAGWLADRLGHPNPIAATADRIGGHTTLMLLGLILVAVSSAAWALLITRRPAAVQLAKPSTST